MRLGSIAAALAALAILAAAPAPRAQEAPPDEWYPVESLPAANIRPPAGIDLSSPRATVRSFLTAFEAGEYEAAASALHLPEDMEEDPAELARMLGEVIDRRLWIDGDGLSDRADAAVELAGDSGRGQPRKSIELGSLDLGAFPASIRLNRLLAPDAGPVWLFARHTVRDIPALYARYGPGWLERRLPAWWRAETSLTIRRWELLALPGLVLVCGLIGFVVSRFLRFIASRLAEGWFARGVRGARMPLALLAAAIFAQVVVDSALGFSALISSVLTPVLIGVIAIALGIAVLRVIDAGLEVVTQQYVGEIDDGFSRDERQLYTSIYALRRVVTLIIFLVAAGFVLAELGAFRNLGIGLLTSAGIATVILGIAGQTVLGNILASLQIAIAKPIRIGDSVLYEGDWAYVESIFYTFVRLRTWDERRLIVPVKYFISHPFENWSMVDAKLTQTFWMVVDHDADTFALREKFEELAEADEDAMDDEPLKMQVLKHDADGVHCRFYVTARDPTTAWDMHARIREDLIAWVREEHPEWWPRERLRSVSGTKAGDADD